MDEKDLEIAHLKGQIESYQDQLRSIALSLLRRQVAELQQADRNLEEMIFQAAATAGKFQTEITDRVNKASEAFVTVRDEVAEIRKKLLEQEASWRATLLDHKEAKQ